MRQPEKEVDIYIDGACSKNPGPGGWAAILIYKGTKKELYGYAQETTNNRMEVYASIAALRALKQNCRVNIYTDSSYLYNAFQEGWLISWQNNGWKNAKKEPVENQDLWKELLNALKAHKVIWNKVKGHSDNQYNNRCDALARKMIRDNVREEPVKAPEQPT